MESKKINTNKYNLEKIFNKCYKESNESFITTINMVDQLVFNCAVVKLTKIDSDVLRPLNLHRHYDLSFQKVMFEVYEKIKYIHRNSYNSQYEISRTSSRVYSVQEVLSALEDEHE